MTDKPTHTIQQETRELIILNVIANALNGSLNLHEMVQTTLAQVADLLNLRAGWVWLRQEDAEGFYLAATQNLPPALANEAHHMQGSCYCLDSYQDGDLTHAVNVIRCSRLKHLRTGTAGLRYHASIPLYAHDKELGVLNVADTDWRELTPAELRLLYTIGDMLGLAIERAQLFARSAQIGALQERNRLAREIHDTLAQELTGIGLQLESADALLEAGADATVISTIVRQALTMTRSGLQEARRSVLDLRAAPLEGRHLSEALADLAVQNSNGELVVLFVESGGAAPLSARVEMGLYRIAQESIRNVQQHANGHQATIKLTYTPTEVQLIITDDGDGFDPDVVPTGHYGLRGMYERVHLLNGHISLQSTPSAGTHLEITIPYEGN